MHIYPEDQVGENFFDVYYHPFKKQIWGVGIVFAVVVLTVLGVRHFHKSRLDEQWTRYHTALGVAGSESLEPAERLRRLQRLATDYPEDDVTPWALAAIADQQRQEEDYDAAIATLQDLEARFPEFGLNTLSSTGTEGGTTLSSRLQDVLASEKSWKEKTRYEHLWPDGGRAALVETTAGSFWIGFYDEQAPDHVAAFVAKAKAGDYNGTQVYEVRTAVDGKPRLFAAGSRASKTESDPSLHDRDEPLHTREPGPSRHTIRHLRRIVASVEMPSGESDQRFMVITADDGMSRYDGQTSPFAAVLEKEGSLEVMDRIGRATTYSTNPETTAATGTFRMRDHPYPSVRIRRVSVWADEKLEDGHTWDTSRVATEDAEPWEADLPPDPLPEGMADDGDDDDAGGAVDDSGDTDDPDGPGDDGEDEDGSDDE